MKKIIVLHRTVEASKVKCKYFPWSSKCNYMVDGKMFEAYAEGKTKLEAVSDAIVSAYRNAIQKAYKGE